MVKDAFSNCHPIVNFTFYIGALLMGMCLIHPVFLCISLLLSLSYYVMVKRECLKYLAGMSGVFLAIAIINPLFNTQGEKVLFTYLNGRMYTLEALCYGIAIGAMFVTIITWFSTYNAVVTSDKFLYCFGKLAPSVSLILTMVFRMVPQFQKKSRQIIEARKCIGKTIKNGHYFEKAEHGMTTVSALTTWALEGGVVMADSMKSRGFGSSKRTSFSIYCIRRRDKYLLIMMLLLFVMIVVCAFCGGMKVSYIPQLKIAGVNQIWMVLGAICYFLFLSIPTTINIMEVFIWRILKSRI